MGRCAVACVIVALVGFSESAPQRRLGEDVQGHCSVVADSGTAIDEPCSPAEFLAALKDGPGSFNFTLPLGGCAFHPSDVLIEDGQTVEIVAHPNSTEPAPVRAHFTVHGSLRLDFVRIEGSRRGVAFMMGQETRLQVDRCVFAENHYDFGGAIAMIDGDLQVRHSTFENNVDENAGYGGGAIYSESGVVGVHDCDFRGNRALSRGGAIFINGGGHDQRHVNLIVDSCRFENNVALEGSAIHVTDLLGDMDLGWQITNSNFSFNIPASDTVVFHGKDDTRKAWSDAVATGATVPNRLIKCDPDSRPPEMCPGGLPCPHCGQRFCWCL